MSVVYTDDPNYVAPSGTIVRPLSEHPSIQDDVANGFSTGGADNGSDYCVTNQVRRFANYIEENGPSTTNEIANAFGFTRQTVHKALLNNPHIFEAGEQIKRQGVRGVVPKEWRLT